MPQKRFTIALPVRNGGSYLRLCVESILGQSCGDFELAILDNASTDGTADYLATLRDERVRLHPADRPLSITENWARIRTIPKNEFLTTIGHDDLLDPGFLAVISRLIGEHPDASLYFAHFRLIDAEGKRLRSCRPMPGRETAAEFLAARLCLLRDSFGTGHVLRSATYDAVGGIPAFPELLYADDALFLQAMGSSYRATALDEVFSYRWHAASASTGCEVRNLFAGLERYGRLLADLRAGDPALAEVLRRYFPAEAVRLGRLWKHEEHLKAYQTRALPDPGVEARISELASLFGDAADLPPFTDPWPERLLHRASRSTMDRAVYAAWRASEDFRLRFKGRLSRLLARRRLAGKP